ncbi:MAG TPA: hypothetical protein VMJ32_12805 [Pirellulales bacterium]|nr:hypothetical protein [Pirellulales bacterium]
MEFFTYPTAFEANHKRSGPFTHAEFMAEARRKVAATDFSDHQQKVEIDRYQAEIHWLELGKPYFNIWPSIIPMLTDVQLDVPADTLKLPYPVFVLRLPPQDNPLTVCEGHIVQSILVLRGVKTKDNQHCVVLWIDIGERVGPLNMPSIHWGRLDMDPDKTIDAAFGGIPDNNLPGINISDELRRKCLRLAVSICFLSTGMDKLVEPDILSKDIAAYAEAHRKNDTPRIKTIEERAVRRGKLGFNVGKSEHLRPLINPPNNADATGTRGELTHSHLRKAHFRKIATQAVPVFVRPAVVRPDLPPAEHSPGYAVR